VDHTLLQIAKLKERIADTLRETGLAFSADVRTKVNAKGELVVAVILPATIARTWTEHEATKREARERRG
jgi:hypothetical protein